MSGPEVSQPVTSRGESEATDEVLFYWRPGCVFCLLLRRELDHAGIVRRDINIWNDPAAAAQVREVAEGNEIVPTVVVGGEALLNPTGDEVRELVSRRAPHLLVG